jgi:Tol biopolymer transport system component
MYHIPTKKFVAVGKFEFRINGKYSNADPGIFRVDLHPRFSPDGRKVSFDSTHEGLGRQIYIIDIGFILDNPPKLN